MFGISKLSEVADVVDSLHKTPKYSDVGSPMVRCTDVKYGRLKLGDSYRVSDKVFGEFSRRYKPRRNDIVITRVGSYGITALVDDTNFCLGQNTSAIIPKINPRYLYAALNSPQIKNQIEFSVVGSTQKTLSLKAINNLEIPRFDEPIEEKIAEIIGGLDDKIELNRQINQTLEHIAQAIFKSWFVDFEPVRAKIQAKQNGQDPERAAMCAISGKTDAELDAFLEASTLEQRQQLTATAALFPDELEDSDLGLIPKGWKVRPLSKMMEIIGGGTPKKSESTYWDGNIPWFSVKDAPADGDVFVIDTVVKITEAGLNRSSTKLLPEGVTIISARGTVGRLAVVGLPMAMNQSCYGLKGRGSIGRSFNYFNLKQAVSTLKRQTHGAVFDTITTKTFDTVFGVEPGKVLLEEFEEIIFPIFERMMSGLIENRSLVSMRDSLLPKLLSGEIGVNSQRVKEGAVA